MGRREGGHGAQRIPRPPAIMRREKSERLEQLEQLYADGAISDTEYQARRLDISSGM